MTCCGKIQMENVLQEAVDSVHDLNMENSTTKKLNSHQTKLGMVTLLCLSLQDTLVVVGF